MAVVNKLMKDWCQSYREALSSSAVWEALPHCLHQGECQVH